MIYELVSIPSSIRASGSRSYGEENGYNEAKGRADNLDMTRILVLDLGQHRNAHIKVKEGILVPHWMHTGSGRKPQSAIVPVVRNVSTRCF